MQRLNPLAILNGHWLGLSFRTEDVRLTKAAEYPPDKAARRLTIAIPLLVTVVAMILCLALGTPAFGGTGVGVVVAGATLVSAGMLSAFALLAGWRERLTRNETQQTVRREWGIRCLLDESVAHILLAVLESVMIMITAIGAAVLPPPVAAIPLALTAGIAAHMLFLFVVISTRLYSAYTDTQEVPEQLDGRTRSHH